jgi:hypothetical protein
LPVVTTALHVKTSTIPILNWSAEGFAAANLVIVALMLGFSPFPFQNRTWAWRTIYVISIIEILNGLIHIAGAIIMGGYFSGSITAIFLIATGIMLFVKIGKNYGR